MNSTFVNNIMSKNVLTVDKSTSLQEAALKMRKSKVGCVIVTEDTKLIGIVTERDFVTKVAAEGRPLFTNIYEVMSSPLITIDPEETVWEAAEMMKEKELFVENYLNFHLSVVEITLNSFDLAFVQE